MKAGEIALARLPQADLGDKLRPALLLCQFPPFGDWLACGVSSQVRHFQAEFDELMDAGAPDCAESGLRVSSVTRLGYLSTLSPRLIGGVLGSIRPERMRRLLETLSGHFATLAQQTSP